MTKLRYKLQLLVKYSIISIFFTLMFASPIYAEETQKFNFGFDHIESMISQNSFNWNSAYAHAEASKNAVVSKKSTASSMIKRFAAISASILVEFTSNDSFNEIEVN